MKKGCLTIRYDMELVLQSQFWLADCSAEVAEVCFVGYYKGYIVVQPLDGIGYNNVELFHM